MPGDGLQIEKSYLENYFCVLESFILVKMLEMIMPGGYIIPRNVENRQRNEEIK